MSGLPLNHQLTDLGGRQESKGGTAAHYKLYALPGSGPRRPGLVRVAANGASVELEVWSLPAEKLGAFARQIPSPLGLGSVALADGSTVLGFLCEAYATAGATDITSFGGWRGYLKSLG
jgi:allophanate hydrolase